MDYGSSIFWQVTDFHALRHTFITNLAQAGVHPKTAQALARHSTITLTMDRYTHALQEDQTRALDVLPSLRGRGDDSEAQNHATHESHGALYGAQKVRKHAKSCAPWRQSEKPASEAQEIKNVEKPLENGGISTFLSGVFWT